MSVITNPEVEMNVTCGFFNSSTDNRRRYDASDFGRLFDGMVTDGVFASIGDCMVVHPYVDESNHIVIGTGKCWFDHTWTLVTEPLVLACPEPPSSSTTLKRIDAVVLEVNENESVLDNVFKIVTGTPSSSPKRPSLVNDIYVHQHALCYILRKPGVQTISEADITNVIGTNETPFITAILQTVSLDKLLGQWQAQLDEFVAARKNDVDTAIAEERAEFDDARKDEVAKFDTARKEEVAKFTKARSDAMTDYNTWATNLRAEMESLLGEVDSWYSNTGITISNYLDNMRNTLASDAATALQMNIDKNEIVSILMNGFADGSKTISKDGTEITSTDSKGRTLVKTFTNEFSTSVTVLRDSVGTELGRLTKNVSSDGLNITSEINLL